MPKQEINRKNYKLDIYNVFKVKCCNRAITTILEDWLTLRLPGYVSLGALL